MRLLLNSPRLCLLTGRGREALVGGANALRFHSEIRRPDNASLQQNYRSLRARQIELRTQFRDLLYAEIASDDLEVVALIGKMDEVARQIVLLRKDVLAARTSRIFRDIAERLAA